jgi:hypothetical protein
VSDGYIQIKEAKNGKLLKEELTSFDLMVGSKEMSSLEMHGYSGGQRKNCRCPNKEW